MTASHPCPGCGKPRDEHPAPVCRGPGGKGCGAPVTGEVFNMLGGLVLCCEACGLKTGALGEYRAFRPVPA